MIKIVILCSRRAAFFLSSPLTMWIILELNFLSFICLISSYFYTKPITHLIIYFLAQRIGSLIILYSIFLRAGTPYSIFSIIITIALLLKLGGAPFHFWYLKIFPILSFVNIWLVSVWQKLIPIFFLRKIRHYQLICVAVLLRATIGSIGIFKQNNLKKILALSSLFNLAWILVSMLYSNWNWLYYLAAYGIALFTLLISFKGHRALRIQKLTAEINWVDSIIVFVAFLIIRGLPPFIIFFIKIWILKDLVTLMPIYGGMMLILTIFALYAYLQIVFSSLRLSFNKSTPAKIFTNGSPLMLIVTWNFFASYIANSLIL